MQRKGVVITMKTILFQGDSITDAGRVRENPDDLGQGYSNFIAGRLGLQQPGTYKFLNRGLSGNRIVDLYARMKVDIINLKPDYISILIGVNDAWHEKDWKNGVSTPKFKRIYSMLLEEVQEALPNTKIMLMEPFVLNGSATEDAIEWFREEVGQRALATKELAEEFYLPFVPLQEDLDQLAQIAPTAYWLIDGVHPTPFFHQYLADKWLETFQTKL